MKLIRPLAAGIAGAVVAAAVAAAAVLAPPLERLKFVEPPREVPAFSYRDEAGANFDLSRYRGKVVVLNLWAVWCLPCREEMPALARLAEAVAGEPIAVVPVAIDRRGPALVKAFMEKLAITSLPVLLASGPAVVDSFDFDGLPFTVILDADGKEVARAIGPGEWDDPAFVAFLREKAAQTRSAERNRQ